MRLQPRRVWSFRAALIRIHRDLFLIEQRVMYFEGINELSEFEKLVLILEDRRFLMHGGVDLRACLREVMKAAVGRKHGGASTIDMQFVRTATGFRENTTRRKLYEILLSVIVQFRYSKLMILRSYLNCAFFGSGLIGIKRASKRAFGVSPEQLSRVQAAELAGMLVYPKPLRPEGNWHVKIRRRADYGLRRMVRFQKSFEKVPSRK